MKESYLKIKAKDQTGEKNACNWHCSQGYCLIYDELLEIHKYKVKMGKKYMTAKQSNPQKLSSAPEYSSKGRDGLSSWPLALFLDITMVHMVR